MGNPFNGLAVRAYASPPFSTLKKKEESFSLALNNNRKKEKKWLLIQIEKPLSNGRAVSVPSTLTQSITSGDREVSALHKISRAHNSDVNITNIFNAVLENELLNKWISMCHDKHKILRSINREVLTEMGKTFLGDALLV